MPVPPRSIWACTILIVMLVGLIALQSRSITTPRLSALQPRHHFRRPLGDRSFVENSSFEAGDLSLTRRTTAKDFTDKEYRMFRVYGYSQAERLWGDPNARSAQISYQDFQNGWSRICDDWDSQGAEHLHVYIGLEGLTTRGAISASPVQWRRARLNQDEQYDVPGHPKQAPTDAHVSITLSKAFEAMIFTRVSTPWFSLEQPIPERQVKNPPPVHQFKDLLTYEWSLPGPKAYKPKLQQSSVKLFLYLNVAETDETLGVINRILGRADGISRFGQRGFVTLPIGSAGYYALMGTQPGLNTIDYLIANTFNGQRYTVASVSIVKLGQNNCPSLFFAAAPADQAMLGLAQANSRAAGDPGDWNFPYRLIPLFAQSAPKPWIHIQPSGLQPGPGQSSGFGGQAGASQPGGSSSPNTPGQPGRSSQQGNSNQPGSAAHRLDRPPPRLDAAAVPGQGGSHFSGANPRPARPGKEPTTSDDYIHMRYQALRPSMGDVAARRRIAQEYVGMHPGVSEAEALRNVNRALGGGSKQGEKP